MPTNKKNQDLWNFLLTVVFLLLVGAVVYYFRSYGEVPSGISPLGFAIVSLATFRLIRLFVYDDVTSYIHDYLRKYENGPQKALKNLLSCPWCTGMWMALLVAFLYFFSPLTWFFVLVIAIAGAGTFIELVIERVEK